MANTSGTLENSFNKYLWDICYVSGKMLNAENNMENGKILKKKKSRPEFPQPYLLNART